MDRQSPDRSDRLHPRPSWDQYMGIRECYTLIVHHHSHGITVPVRFDGNIRLPLARHNCRGKTRRRCLAAHLWAVQAHQMTLGWRIGSCHWLVPLACAVSLALNNSSSSSSTSRASKADGQPRSRIEDHRPGADRTKHPSSITIYTADYLNQSGQNATLVTVEGAVNTIYLRTRQTNHDVDFFGSHLSQRQLELIDEAMQYAERMSSAPLGGAWLNNEIQLHMAPDVRQRLTERALEQNVKVFQAAGLTIVVAP